MANIIAGTLRAGKKARDKQGSDDHLSKVVELNGKYRLFFRTIEIPDSDGMKDIGVAVVPGRSLDFDVCGTSFISYDKSMCEISEDGSVDDKTGLAAWARIARVIHNAQCIREKKNAEAEAERTAQELGKSVDQVKLAQKLEGIDIRYNGGKAADGTKIAPTERPCISGVQQKMTTQLLVIKMLPNNTPDWNTAKYAVLEISNQRMNELIALIDNPDYFDNDLDYFEVGYDYIGSDKQSAGRAAKFQGIAKSLSLKTQFPADWEKFGENLVNGLVNAPTIPELAELMKSRNRNLKIAHTPNEIVTSMKKWCANNAAVFGSIDFEDENTTRAAKDFIDSNLLNDIPSVKERFESIVAEQEAKKGEAEDTDDVDATAADETATTAEETKTGTKGKGKSKKNEEKDALKQATEVMNAGDGAQTLAQMVGAVPNLDVGDGDDGIGDLD